MDKTNPIRQMNEQKVIRQIIANGTISRSQISRNLGLNKPSVSEIVDKLINQGFVTELGPGESTSSGGRRPTNLQLNVDFGYVVIYELGEDVVYRMMSRIDASVFSVTEYAEPDHDIQKRMQIMIAHAQDADAPKGVPLRGVAVAVHGIVDQNQVVFSPFLDFKKVDVAKQLNTNLHVPVKIENEANLSAIYVRDFDNHQRSKDLICISIHQGIGAGIIIDGRLRTGNHGEAGEIGQSVVYDHSLSSRGQLRTIESICSETAILQIVRERTGWKNFDLERLVSWYRRPDSLITGILNDFCYYIANVIYNVTMTIGPERIALNSRLIQALPELLIKIQNNIPKHASSPIQIDLVSDVRQCTLLGGCSVILRELLNTGEEPLTFKHLLS